MFEFNLFIYVFIFLGLFIFLLGLFINNKDKVSYLSPTVVQFFTFGRAAKTVGKSLIPQWIQVPKSWFAHFYLYCTILQAYIFYTLVSLYVFKQNPLESNGRLWLSRILETVAGNTRFETVTSGTSLLVSCLFLIQVSRRLYETRCVSVFSDTKMNVGHYVLGFFHYTCSSLSLISNSPTFVTQSSTNNEISWDSVKEELTVLKVFGILLFIYGTVQQNRAHVTLANLRKRGNEVVSQKHQIPRGGLFELISTPNYWAEILIYVSLAIILGFQNSCWNAITFWVFCNQVPAGDMNHNWYKEKFPEYPKNRKAIIPYIW